MASKESKKIVKTYNKVAKALIEFEALWYQVRTLCYTLVHCVADHLITHTDTLLYVASESCCGLPSCWLSNPMAR